MKNKTILLLLATFFGITDLFGQEQWSVDDCMRHAVEHSPQSKKQALLEDDARHTLTESALGFLPALSASTGLNTQFGRSIDPVTNTYVSTANLGNSYGLNGSMGIFNGLQTLNQYKIARVSKLNQALISEQVNTQIATRTMQSYYRVIFAYGALSVAQDELADSRKNHKKKKVEYEVGLASISDISQLESSVSQGEYNVIFYEGAYQKSLIELKNEMYYPLDKELQIDTVSTIPSMITMAKESVSSIFSTAIDFLPDYKIMKSYERIAKLNLSTYRASLFPSINLGGGISTGYSRVLGTDAMTHTIFKTQLQDRMGQYVQLSMSIPIFNGLSRQKNIQRSKNAYERSRIDSQQKGREIERLITESVIDLESYEKQVNQSAKNVRSNSLSYRTTEVKFSEGLSSVIDLQTTQTNLSRAKIEQIESFLNYLMQRRIVDYYKGTPIIR